MSENCGQQIEIRECRAMDLESPVASLNASVDVTEVDNIEADKLHDELTLLQAIAFIEDAESYRSIHHRVDKKALYASHIYNMAPIRWFRMTMIVVIHLLAFLEYPSSLSWQSDVNDDDSGHTSARIPGVPIIPIMDVRHLSTFRMTMIVVIHLLAFLERPSSLSWTSDIRIREHRYEFDCGILESIEFFCLITFCFDVGVKVYLIGKHNALRSKWIMAYVFVLAVSLIDWFVSLGLGCKYLVRVRRYLRPFFIIQNSYLMKKMANCLRRTIPEVVSVLLLLALHLFMFTLFGLLLFRLFPNESNPNPDNSTHVDSGHISYNDSIHMDEGAEYFASLFDALKNLLVLLTTANNPDVSMPAYRKNRLYQIYFVVFLVIGLFCFMNMLTAVIYNQFRGYFLNSMQSSLFRRRVAVRATFEILSQRMDVMHHNSVLPMRALVEIPTLILVVQKCKIKKATQQSILEHLHGLPHHALNVDQFKETFSLLDVEHGKPKIRMAEQTRWRYLRWLQSIILHKYFAYLGNIVVISNVIFIAVELATSFTKIKGNKHTVLSLINLIFIMYYVVEQSLKLWAQGWRMYISCRANVFDAFITVSLVVVEIFYLTEFGFPNLNHKDRKVPGYVADILWNIVRFINILITVRLLRIIPHIKTMSVVASTIMDLVRSMKSFMGILVAIYYVFAILGIALFAESIHKPHQNTTNTTNYTCGSYRQLEYWANNFDDFAAALVVLWDVMVVNNWHVFLDAYGGATSRWAYLYFVVWWLLSVIICLNLFTALILENFIMKWDKNQQQRSPSDHSASIVSSHTLTLHDMFRDGLREPVDNELLIELSQHRFLNMR